MEAVQLLVLVCLAYVSVRLSTAIVASAVQTLPWLVVYHVVIHDDSLRETLLPVANQIITWTTKLAAELFTKS